MRHDLIRFIGLLVLLSASLACSFGAQASDSDIQTAIALTQSSGSTPEGMVGVPSDGQLTATEAATPFVPMEFTGTGPGTTPTFVVERRVYIDIDFQGSGPLQIQALQLAGDGYEVEVVRGREGPYQGTTVLDVPNTYSLEVVSGDGPWTLTVRPATTDETMIDYAEGTGDWASPLFNPPLEARTYRITNDGSGESFQVHLLCERSRERYVFAMEHELPYDQTLTVSLVQGPCYWKVEGNGTTTIEAQK